MKMRLLGLMVMMGLMAALTMAQTTKPLKDEPKAPTPDANTYFLSTTGTVMNTALVPIQSISNIPLAKITLTNAAAGSNVTLFPSNNVAVTQSANTNDIYVTGAGTAAANGHYVLRTPGASSLIIYSNVNTLTGLGWEPTLDAWHVFDRYEITNLAGVHLYGGSGLWLDGKSAFSGNIGNWEDVDGGDQFPTFVTYGTNFTTNVVISIEAAGAEIPVTALDTNLYVDQVLGNDTWARKGRRDLPYKSVTAALKDLKAWQTVVVAGGTYNETSTVVPLTTTLPVGAKIRGTGIRDTLIVGLASSSTLTLMNSNVISDLSLSNVWIYVGVGFTPGQVATNTLIKRVEATSPGDVWFGPAFWDAYIEDCHFDGNSDKIADAMDVAPGAFTNTFIHVKDTSITGGPGSDGFGLRHASAQFDYQNVHVNVTGMRAELGYQLVSWGSLIHSNSYANIAATIAALIPGDTLDFSSNGVKYVVTKNPGGVLATNKIAP